MASTADGLVDESENISVDSAWELKRYADLLSLLQQDRGFPSEFSVEELDEQDEIQRKLKMFTQERNLLHDWIKNDKLQEVKEFTSNNKSKYYSNDGNYSAAYTALRNRKFKIYAYLQSINVHLMEDESYIMDDLTAVEKHELQDIMLSYFSTMENSHIHYLISKMKIKAKNSCEEYKEDIFGYLEKLNAIPEISIILKVIQHVENLDLVLDLDKENVRMVCPFASTFEKGITFHAIGTVYVAAGGTRKKNQVLGTIAHELTHMAMHVVFNNGCDPYFKRDDNAREEFRKLTESLKTNVAQITGTPFEILINAFRNYSTDEQQSELIARVPHILAQYAEGQEWLRNNAIELFDYFNDRVIPECKKFIEQHYLSKQKCLNRHINESEGEIISLKKCGLLFTSIDKLKIFLSDKRKKIFALITEYTWLGLLRALQAMYGVEYAESYDKFLVLKLDNVVKNLVDVKYVFNSEAAQMLFVECPNLIGNNYKTLRAIKKIMKVVKTKEGKKIIFIIKKEENEDFLEILEDHGLSDAFVQENDEDFSLCELTEESRRKILKSVAVFQGKDLTLADLVSDNENLSKCVNAEIIQEILNNKKIQIGSKPFGTSSLDGAYSDVVHEVNFLTLIYEMKSSNDIFLICGKKNEFDQCLNQDIDIAVRAEMKNFNHKITNNKRIFLTDEEVSDYDFKKFCDLNSKKKIFLIKILKQSTFMLVKIYNPDFYFKRQMKEFKNITIMKDFHLKDISDLFIIGRGSVCSFENNCNSSNVILVDSEKTEIEFEKLSRTGKAVHVLKWENNQLIWVKSHGSLNGLREVIDKDLSEESIIDENELLSQIKDEKVLILADEPGMGKSTTLTKLYENKNISDTNWIIRINLKDHLIPIRNMSDNLNMKQVTKFLMDIDSKLGNDFSRKLLEAALDVSKKFCEILLLCLDGFDELSDDKDRKKIINLLTFLKYNTKCKIWITSRLHFKKTLENNLSVLSVKFNPIDDQSKMDFIKNYLKVRLRLILTKERFDEVFESGEKIQEGSTLWTYAKALIDKAKSIFKENFETFIGTPLQLHLLLENSAPSFRNWIDNSNDPDFSYLGNNLAEVYEKFFDRKYEIYYRKKNLLEEESKHIMKDTFEKCHEKIANSLVNDKKLEETKIAKWKSSLLLLGITKAEDDRIEFVHFTFREYFYARSFIKNFISHSYPIPQENLYRFFIEEILVNKKYRFTRSFINESLKNFETKKSLTKHERKFQTRIMSIMAEKNLYYTPLHCAVKEFNGELLNFLFALKFSKSEYCTIFFKKMRYKRQEKNLEIALFRGGRPREISVFNLAVECKNDFALSGIIDIASKYNLDQQLLISADKERKTALHWAVEWKNDYAFNRLFELATKYNLDQQLLSSVDFDERTPFHLAVAFKYDLAFNKLIEAASKYNLDEQFLSSADRNGRTPLHLAVQWRNDLAFNRFIEIVSKYNLDEQLFSSVDKKEMTPLHWAVEKKNDLAFNRLIEIASKYNLDQQLLTNADREGNTLLHMAVWSKNDLAFNKLLEISSKFNLDEQILRSGDKNGRTLLYLAVWKRYDLAFNRFIEMASKYNLDEQLLTSADKQGDTPLQSAVKSNNDLAFNRLIEMASKYNLDQQLLTSADKEGDTLLQSAVHYENDFAFNRIIELASKYNLDQQLLSIVDKEGSTPLQSAVKSNNDLAFNRLIEIASKYNLDLQLLRSSDKEGDTPLQSAVKSKHDLAFNKLIEMTSKYNIDQQVLSSVDKNGRTPLHLSVKNGNDLALNRIIDIASKYNLDRQLLKSADKKGMNPLHLAVKFGNDLAFNKLTEMASNCNLDQPLLFFVNKKGRSLFHAAVIHHNNFALCKMIEMASKYRLDQQHELLSIVDISGNSVFHTAVAEEDSHFAVDRLIEIVFNFSPDKVYELLAIANKDKETVLHLAVKKEDNHDFNRIFQMVSTLSLNQQYNILNIQNMDGKSVFQSAIGFNNSYALGQIAKMVSESAFSSDQKFSLLRVSNESKRKAKSTRNNAKRSKY